MDDAAQEDAAVQLGRGRGGRPDRRLDEPVARLVESGEDGRVDVRRRREEMGKRQLGRARRMEHRDLDRAERAESGGGVVDEPACLPDRRIEHLHVAEQQAARVGRGRKGVGFGDRERERLLAQDRQAPFERREGVAAVRPGRQEDHAVETIDLEERGDRPHPVCRRDAVAVAERVPEGRRQVADRGDLEGIREPVEQREVDGLGDGAEAGDSDAKRRVGSGRGRAHGPRV